MDKKTIMQTMVDGYDRMRRVCNYDIKSRMSRIADRLDGRMQYIERSRQFWDDISDERIAHEQEKYLDYKRRLEEIVSLMGDLETYMKEENN